MKVEGRGNIDWQKLAAMDEGEAIIRLAVACNDIALAESLLQLFQKEFEDPVIYLGSSFYVMRLMLAHAHETKILIEELKANQVYGERISKIIVGDKEAALSWLRLKNLKGGNVMELTRNKGIAHYSNKEKKRAEKEKEEPFGEWIKDALIEVSKMKRNAFEFSIYSGGQRFHFADRVMMRMFEEKIVKSKDHGKIAAVSSKMAGDAWTIAHAIVCTYLEQICTTKGSDLTAE